MNDELNRVKKRPKMTDPEEWAIIRSMYFRQKKISDPEEAERLERERSREKQKNHAR